MRHSLLRHICAASSALALIGGCLAFAGERPVAADNVQAVNPAQVDRPYTFTAAATEGGSFVHWVGEFPQADDVDELEHYGDWVLDKLEIPAEDQGARWPAGDGGLMTEIDMVFLFLTADEAEKANGMIGQNGLAAAETTGIVSLPEPVQDGGGPLSPPGQMGRQWTPAGVQRAGTPLDEWGNHAPSMAGVRVAVIDTGIDASHDDLEGQVVDGFNCSQDARGPEGWGIDLNGHGTWVAGAIGAKHNDIYVASGAPGVTLLDEITFSAEGSASGAMVLCSVNKALEHGADIISASLGGGHIATRCDGPSVYTNGWCKAAHRAVVIVAAGNDAVDAIHKGPANVPGVVAVGAIVDFDGIPEGLGLGQQGCGFNHRDDHYASFSNWGSTVTVVANGGCELGLFPGQSWGIASGTSMSTPRVSAVFAAFMAEFPDCRGRNAIRTVITYAEWWARDHPEDGYSGWPGAPEFAPPLIRYVDEDPLAYQDPQNPRPCAFAQEDES